VSSDYPAAARRALEDAFGGVAIFVSGPLGGLLTPLGASLTDPDSGQAVPEKTFRMAGVLGGELARSVIDAWRKQDDARVPDRSGSTLTRGVIEVRAREFGVPLEDVRSRRGRAEGRLWPRTLGDDGRLTSEAALLTLR